MSLLLLFQPQTTIGSTVTKTQGAISRIATTRTQTQPSIARVARTVTKTQGAVARISVPATQIVFTSPSESADFGTVAANDNTVTVGNVGTGYVGKSIRFNFSATSNEGSVHKVLTSTGRIMQLWLKVDTAATLSTTNDATVIHAFSDNFTTAFIDLRIIGVGTGFTVRTIDPTNSFASSVGVTVLAKGVWHRVVLEVTDTAHKLYLNNQTAPEVNYTHTNTGLNIASFALGKWYNAASAFVGIMDIDNVWVGNPAASVSTTAQQIADAWVGYKQKYLSLDGAIVRPPSEGSNLGFTLSVPDVVSEGQAYGLKLAVQNNDQTTFDLIETWTVANMIRSVSTVGNTQNNAAPTTALTLMAFHYNTSNSDGKGANTIYDANFATDADVDRAQALLWAHGRYGSGGTINYLSRALAILADLRTYGLRQSSATGFYYLVNDSFQTGDPVQIAPDYNNPAAFKLFAQYDSTNAAIWNGAVSGAYDIINKVAAQQMTGQAAAVGLNANWIAFTLSTGLTSATASTYGDPNYGFNAFRSAYRIYDAYNWYGDTNALTSLQKPKSFFTTTWAGGSIKATYNHDGTNAATYELNYFYYPAYWSIYANDTANTTAAAILSGKLASTYLQKAFGSYLNESAGGTQYAYFGQAWMLHGAMQKAGLFINYGQSTTKTQTATARIANNPTKTQSAVARVSAPFTKSQPAISRVSNTRALSQASIARISINRTLTQPAIARILAPRTLTQGLIARISTVPTKFQPAVARIVAAATKTQPATARMTRGTTKIQSAIARIVAAGSKAQGAVARVSNTRSLTQGATARAANSRSLTQPAVARVATIRTNNQPAIARIAAARSLAQPAIARILAPRSLTQPAIAKIINSRTLIQPAVARVIKSVTFTQLAGARIQRSLTKTQGAVATIVNSSAKNQAATARIAVNLPRTGSALSFSGGANGYVSAPYALPTTAFSVLFFYKTTAVMGNAEGWISQAGSLSIGRQGLNEIQIYAYLNASGDFAGLRRLRIGRNLLGPITDGAWHSRSYLVYVNGTNNGAVDEYEDGVFIRTTTTDYTLDPSTPTGALQIGTQNAAGGASFNGSMDRTVIVDRKLSAGEVASYNRGLLPTTPGAVWEFNENSGTSTADSSGNSHTGTLTGSALPTWTTGVNTPPSQIAISRISNARTLNEPAKARVANSRTLTQPATAHIVAAVTKTQAATARIVINRTLTQPAIARIILTVTKTQAASGRIANSRTLNQPALARVAQTVSKTQSAVAKINQNGSGSSIQLATARIQRLVTKTQPLTARIANSRSLTQPAIAKIANSFTKTQPALSRIANSRSLNQLATARIQRLLTLTQPAVARIVSGRSLAQSATARVATNKTTTIPAIAKIITTSSSAQSAIGRIANNRTKLQTAVARIAISKTFTIPAIARIAKSNIFAQSSTARVSKSLTASQPALARIVITQTKTQAAVANIVLATSRSSTQAAVARVSRLFAKNQATKAAIVAGIVKTQVASARISQNYAKTQSAIAKVVGTRTLTQTVKAYIVQNPSGPTIVVNLAAPRVNVGLSNPRIVEIEFSTIINVALAAPNLTVSLSNPIIQIGLSSPKITANIL